LKQRQFSLKVLEVELDNEDEFIEFFDTHGLLFKNHLISIKGDMSDRIKYYLEEMDFKYINNITLPNGKNVKSVDINKDDNKVDKKELEALEEKLKSQAIDCRIKLQEAQSIINELEKKANRELVVIDDMVRSGKEVSVDGDLLILNRVNSGATIKTTGNLIITQVVEGAIRCDGSFMMLTVSPKANIIFNGVEVDNSLLQDKLNRIELKDNKIYITPVIKKEINWVQ
jgi:septum site-determining protein MinC